MSRVEHAEEKRERSEPRQSDRSRTSSPPSAEDARPAPTPTKAEGEVSDVEQALEKK